MTRKFETKFQNVCDWCKIVDLHWERLLGEYNNDKDFWNDTFHSMNSDDWWDIIDVAKALQIQEPDELRRFPKFSYNIEVIEKRLHKCDPVIKKWNRQGYNVAATGLFMSVRDVLNELAGKPTKRWTDKDRQKLADDAKAHQFLTLFVREQENA